MISFRVQLCEQASEFSIVISCCSLPLCISVCMLNTQVKEPMAIPISSDTDTSDSGLARFDGAGCPALQSLLDSCQPALADVSDLEPAPVLSPKGLVQKKPASKTVVLKKPAAVFKKPAALDLPDLPLPGSGPEQPEQPEQPKQVEPETLPPNAASKLEQHKLYRRVYSAGYHKASKENMHLSTPDRKAKAKEAGRAAVQKLS